MITGTTFPLTLTGPFVAKRISIESSINRNDSNRRSRSLPYLTGLITIIIALPTELVVTAALAHGLALNRITRRSQLTGELIAASSIAHSYSLALQSGLQDSPFDRITGSSSSSSTLWPRTSTWITRIANQTGLIAIIALE